MTPDQFQQVEALFHRGKDLPPEEQRALLDAECGEDPEVRAEVEKLLAHHEEESRQRLTAMGGTETAPADRLPAGLQRIGRYRILERLGEGGMGTVYLAEQDKPLQRRVALKVIKRGMDTGQVIARFEAERQALAVMDHPNVAKVLDAGTTEDGLPYFVMEHVAGVRITEHCDRHNLGIAARLDLFMQVCDAVQHAHQKGIIHRDLKPSNILVSVKDHASTPPLSKGGLGGVPKVIDFGVAKALSQRLTERTLFTEQGQLIGTPEYMSPEQAEMTAQDIDTRSDIYSLGVLLYELLTGSLPFDSKTLRRAGVAEIARIIREQDPPKPSTRLSAPAPTPTPTEGEDLDEGSSTAKIAHHRQTDPKALIRSLRGDLDWIIMKALEKDRTRRYETANGLAADLRRHLNHEPVVASPPSIAYRTKKFIRRNRGLVTGAMVVFLVLVAGITGTTWQAVVATHQRDRAVAAEREQSRALEEAEAARKAEEKQRQEAERQAKIAQAVNEFLNEDLLASVSPEKKGRQITVREVLDVASTKIAHRFQTEPSVEAAVRTTLGNTYFSLGKYKLAKPHLERALAIRRRLRGDEHPLTLYAMEMVARLHAFAGRYSESESMCKKVLELRIRLLGNEHPNTLRTMQLVCWILDRQGKSDESEKLRREILEARKQIRTTRALDPSGRTTGLGQLLSDLGEYGEAEPLLRESADHDRRIFGSEHPVTLRSMSRLANTLGLQQKYVESAALDRDTLQIRQRVLGKAHPDTLSSMQHLAWALFKLGSNAESEALNRKTLKLLRRVLGEEHPDTLSSMNSLAWTLSQLGKDSESEALNRRTLELRRRILGEEHPGTLQTMYQIAINLKQQGKYSDSETLQRKILDLRRKVLGEAHLDTLWSMDYLGVVLAKQGVYSEAEELHHKTLEVRCRVLGEEHPDTLHSMGCLANLHADQGRYDQAEPLYVRTLEVQRRVLGEEHPETLNAMSRLANLYRDQRRYDKAEPLYVEALEKTREILGQEDEFTLNCMNNLAALYELRGMYDQAEPLCLETLEIRRRVLGEEHRSTLGSMNNLAGLYYSQGRYDQAESLYVKTLEIRRRVLGGEHPNTLRTLTSLVYLLRAEKKIDRARPFVREMLASQKKAAEREGASANALNEYAWELLTCDPADLRDPGAALPVAQEAVRKSGDKDPGILDTLALAYFLTGDVAKAIKTQETALSLLPPGDSALRKSLGKSLARFRATAASQPTSQPDGADTATVP